MINVNGAIVDVIIVTARLSPILGVIMLYSFLQNHILINGSDYVINVNGAIVALDLIIVSRVQFLALWC